MAATTKLKENSTAFIGVGSNIGDRYKNIRDAEREINKSGTCKIVRISKIYETDPVGYLNQEKFLNCVFEIKTELSPHKLIKFLLNAEIILKRERIIHWGPRTIDLDILFYNNMEISSENLIIPHPRMHERMFVMRPLCDLIPAYVHPVINESCERIAESLEKQQGIPDEWIPQG